MSQRGGHCVTLQSMNEIDTAWIAGLFEGEGCIYISRNKGFGRVTLKMVDRDIIERLDALFPCPGISVRPPDQPHHQIQYGWTITHSERIREFLALIMPFLGKRRLAKANELLAYLDSRPGQGSYYANKTHCPHGHPYSPENTYHVPRTGARVCKTCRRTYKAEYTAGVRRRSTQ